MNTYLADITEAREGIRLCANEIQCLSASAEDLGLTGLAEKLESLELSIRTHADRIYDAVGREINRQAQEQQAVTATFKALSGREDE